jgi:hypothetical protein
VLWSRRGDLVNESCNVEILDPEPGGANAYTTHGNRIAVGSYVGYVATNWMVAGADMPVASNAVIVRVY